MLRRRGGRRPPGASMALAGSGAGASLHGLAALAAGVPVVAVASRRPEAAAALAERLGGTPCAFDELPRSASLAVVATPPGLHLEHARRTSAGGARTLVEAPLAATLADADALVAMAHEGAPLAYGENLLSAPGVRRSAATARSLGPLTHVEVRILTTRPERRALADPVWGGGALLDLGVRAVAVALLLAGDDEPVSISASLDRSGDQLHDDGGVARLSFRSGLEARVEVSWRHHEAVVDLQVAGSTGVVRTELLPRPGTEVDGEPRPPDPAEASPDPLVRLGFVDQVRRLAAAGAGDLPSLELGRTALELVAAAHASAAIGAPVALPFAGPRDLTCAALGAP